VGGETVGVVVICTVWCVWCSGWDWCIVKRCGRWCGVKSIQNCQWKVRILVCKLALYGVVINFAISERSPVLFQGGN
jgi:hypothetical protein